MDTKERLSPKITLYFNNQNTYGSPAKKAVGGTKLNANKKHPSLS